MTVSQLDYYDDAIIINDGKSVVLCAYNVPCVIKYSDGRVRRLIGNRHFYSAKVRDMIADFLNYNNRQIEALISSEWKPCNLFIREE